MLLHQPRTDSARATLEIDLYRTIRVVNSYIHFIAIKNGRTGRTGHPAQQRVAMALGNGQERAKLKANVKPFWESVHNVQYVAQVHVQVSSPLIQEISYSMS